MLQRPRTPLTHDVILSTTEDVLRRHGPVKATVVDVARELGVSHAAVYKLFPSKQALREAVTRRWLDRTRNELAVIAVDPTLIPAQRLRTWLHAVLTSKQQKLRDSPELFAAFVLLAGENSSVATEHVEDLMQQIEVMVTDGAADGTFHTTNPARTARAVFHATSRFHHITMAPTWQAPGVKADLDAVVTLLLEGLAARL